MKIMAIGRDNYVIQISKREMARLLGYYYENSDDYRGKEPKEGDEVNVNGMYQHLYELRSLKNGLGSRAKELRKFVDILETLPIPIIKTNEEN